MFIIIRLFDLNKAINDDEYASNIFIDENIYYDDYIFVLSTIYASNIPINKWVEVYEKDNEKLRLSIITANVSHCLNWDENIEDEINACNLNKYKFNKEFKSMNESREWVKNKISPILLPILKEKDYITIKDVINTLKLIN